MRIFLITGNVPFPRDDKQGVTAVHIVTYELLRNLRNLGHDITLQVLFNPYRKASQLSHDEHAELQQLRNDGVSILPVLFQSDYLSSRRNLPHRLLAGARRLTFGPRISDFYPSICMSQLMRKRLEESRPEAILTMWSPEGLAATHFETKIPRVAYHGDVDFLPAEARARDTWLFSADSRDRIVLSKVRDRFDLAQFKAAHMRLMKGVDVIANVTASNADFYSEQGHPCSIYVRNTWLDRRSPHLDPFKRKQAGGPIKIIGHTGYLNRTGSTYGLKFLLADLLPELAREMSDLDYEIHIIGGGDISAALRPYLQNKHVVVRGFVPDLQKEMDNSDMILLLNNAGPYQAAYTRHLVAWASGLCLIVHEQSTKAIPEIVHMQNALVGRTPSEIARLVRLAATDLDLNQRLRNAGRATYERYFTPAIVGNALSECISKAVNLKKH